MSEELHLYICEHFIDETKQLLKHDNFKGASVSYFPSRCARPIKANKHLSTLNLFDKSTGKDKLFCGCSCLSAGDKAYLSKENVTQLHLDNCFKMFYPQEHVNALTKAGAYLITSSWLNKWQKYLAEWGKIEHIRQMFSESITELVLLDTGVNPKQNEQLRELSAHLQCSSRKINVGLDYYRLYLENKVLKQKLQSNTALKPKGSVVNSDFAMALDLMSNLPKAQKEKEIAKRILEVFIMLFAAKKVNYLSFEDDSPKVFYAIPAETDGAITQARLQKWYKDINIYNSAKGFYLKVMSDKNVLAIIEVEALTFPENTSKYQNLASIMKGVIALSIENARFYEETVRKTEKLSELNSTKTKLFSIIGHDLRSPFNTIIGFSGLLHARMQNDKSKKFSKVINTTAKSTLELLDNLLSWAKTQTGKFSYNPEVLHLPSVINEVVSLSQNNANHKGIYLNCVIEEDIVLESDKNMIQTILRNLISNALKFTQSQGSVLVEAERQKDCIEITVNDTGVGMDSNTVKTLFNIKTNKTTKGTNNEKGSGLGLVLCKELVSILKGEIWIKSTVGEGSEFKFTIPINPA